MAYFVVEMDDPASGFRLVARLSLLALLASGSVSALAAQPLTEFHYSVNWTAATNGGLGAGLAVEDLDGDGRDEIVSVSHNYWQILRRQGNRLREVWSSLPRGPEFSEVRALIEPTTGRSVVLLSTESTIELWDGRLRTKFDELTLPSASITTFLPADIDLDGDLEIVACDVNDLYLSDYATGALQLVKYGFGCTDLDLGQFDGDAAPELLLAGNGLSGLVLDGASLTVDWAYLAGFSSRARFVQADADATAEIVTSGSEYPDEASVIDPDTSSVLYTVSQAAFEVPIEVGDLDGDGGDELYVAEYVTGDVEVLDAETGAQIRLLDRAGYADPVELAMGDSNADGLTEVIAASRFPEDGEGDGTVTVFRPSDGLVAAGTVLARGDFEALATGGLEADGSIELVAGEGFQPYGSLSRLLTFSATSGREITARPLLAAQVADLAVADLELDGDEDVCAAVDQSLRCYVEATTVESWTFSFPGAITPQAIALADVRGDALPELIVATSQNGSTGGPFVYAFDGATGLLRWRSADPGDELLGPFKALLVAELLPDSGLEILALSWNGTLFLFDDTTGATLAGPSTVDAAEFLGLADLDADPEVDLVVATFDGTIEIVDPATGTIESVLAEVGTDLVSFAVADVTRDGDPDFVYTTYLHELVIWNPVVDAVIWTSGELGFFPGGRNSLLAGNLDHDSVPEIAVDTGFGFVIVEAPLDAIFADGFESGDTSAWSGTIP